MDVYRGTLRRRAQPAVLPAVHPVLSRIWWPGRSCAARTSCRRSAGRKRWSWPRFTVGGRLILLGALQEAGHRRPHGSASPTRFSGSPDQYETGVVWMAAIAYALQIYCDFSGYSDIALGTARICSAIELAINFNMPYASANISEFWRRWHISLSSWIRDYLYIPLGGNRGSTVRTAFNLLFTMTLCGLWHGANWTFVVWGALNGAYLLVHCAFKYVTRGMDVAGNGDDLAARHGVSHRLDFHGHRPGFRAIPLAVVRSG